VTQGDTDRETTPHRLSDLNESERDRRFAALIPSQQRCHLIPYNATVLERDIALTLGIPMYGTDPRLADLGSKDGRPPIVRRGSGASSARCGDLHSSEVVGKFRAAHLVVAYPFHPMTAQTLSPHPRAGRRPSE
jgi:hypothetical protein